MYSDENFGPPLAEEEDEKDEEDKDEKDEEDKDEEKDEEEDEEDEATKEEVDRESKSLPEENTDDKEDEMDKDIPESSTGLSVLANIDNLKSEDAYEPAPTSKKPKKKVIDSHHHILDMGQDVEAADQTGVRTKIKSSEDLHHFQGITDPNVLSAFTGGQPPPLTKEDKKVLDEETEQEESLSEDKEDGDVSIINLLYYDVLFLVGGSICVYCSCFAGQNPSVAKPIEVSKGDVGMTHLERGKAAPIIDEKEI